MKKQNLHQYLIAAIVSFSLLSFIYLNFFTSHISLSVQNGKAVPQTTVNAQKIDKDDQEDNQSAPKIVAVSRLFDLVQKLVPSGK